MSDKIFPLPIDTPISDDQKFSAFKFGSVWNRFFKALSDDLMAANLVNNLAPSAIVSPVVPTVTQAQLNAAAKALKYTLNANRVDVTYYNDAPLSVALEIALPYTAALAFDFGGVTYAPGTKTVTIAPSTSYVRFWFVAQTTRN